MLKNGVSRAQAKTEMRHDEEDLPPDSITILEKLVYNVRPQESRDTSDLSIEYPSTISENAVPECV